MEKIELNECIIEGNVNYAKKLNYQKSVKLISGRNNFEERKNNESIDSLNNPNIKKRRTHKNNIKYILKEKKLQRTKDREEVSKKNNEQNENTSNINSKNIEKISTKNVNKENIFENDEKYSIDSQITVNSKLFNNKKDYLRYKKLMSREDLPLFEEILSLLKTNQK